MFQATNQQIENMRRVIAELYAGGDDAFARTWLVWAEVHLNTLDISVPTVTTEKILPLIYWLEKTSHSPRETVRQAIHQSLPRVLWQAKLEGRDLSVEDGYAALEMIRSSLREGD